MAFASPGRGGPATPMTDINMIPLIDVMLVLMVIFIVTAPLLTHAVKVDLPKASSTPNVARAETVQLAVERDGAVLWNGERIDRAQWRERMQAAAQLRPQPEIHLRADGDVAYRRVAEIMSDAARFGLTRLGFVTEPVAGQ